MNELLDTRQELQSDVVKRIIQELPVFDTTPVIGESLREAQRLQELNQFEEVKIPQTYIEGDPVDIGKITRGKYKGREYLRMALGNEEVRLLESDPTSQAFRLLS